MTKQGFIPNFVYLITVRGAIGTTKINGMYFKEEDIQSMKKIFRRLEPKMIESIQFYSKENDLRTGCTIVIHNKWKKPICVFQNFVPLSPYRMKLLMRLSGQIPFPIHITKPREDIMRIGWKFEK
jgi:hypothetical protein